MITKEEAIKAYEDLIQLRRSDVLIKDKTNPGSIEIHHILPKSCGGIDNDENKIALYAKEHFMAHVYLWIIHHDDEFHDQTVCALNNMAKGTSNGSRKELRDFILASDEYQKAREEFAQYTSKLLSEANMGSKNSNYGKHWYYDPITLSCQSFYDYNAPENWILGRKFKDPKKFSEITSKNSKDTVWIRSKDLLQQKHVKQEVADIFIATNEWEYGIIPLTNEQKEQKYLKFLETKTKNSVGIKNIEIVENCLYCNETNSNKYKKFCCDECKRKYHEKQLKELKIKQIMSEVQQIDYNKQFKSQTNDFYKGVVNRGQVRQYLEFKGYTCCNKCGKEHVKLIVHAIDGNYRNLSIDNYEFLCRECYLESGTAGFSGKSMKKINDEKRNISLQ